MIIFIYDGGYNHSIFCFDYQLSILAVMTDLCHIALIEAASHLFEQFYSFVGFQDTEVAKINKGHPDSLFFKFWLQNFNVILSYFDCIR